MSKEFIEKMVMKVLDFVLDMKNILSVGALVLTFVLVKAGVITSEQAYTLILMTFSFFLGSKTKITKE